jgi:hypothetical protein
MRWWTLRQAAVATFPLPTRLSMNPLWNRGQRTSHPCPININLAFYQRPGRIQQPPHVSSQIGKFLNDYVNWLSKANSEVCESLLSWCWTSLKSDSLLTVQAIVRQVEPSIVKFGQRVFFFFF